MIGRSVGISNVDVIVDQVVDTVSRWPQFAREVELNEQRIKKVAHGHRLIEFDTDLSAG